MADGYSPANRRRALSCVAFVLVVSCVLTVGCAGCSTQERTDGRLADDAGAGQAQEARPDRASLLGRALQDLALLGDAACSEGDARGCSDGSFFALVLSVDPGSNAVVADPVEYYTGAGAAAAAARDGRRLNEDEGVYVRNRDAARLELPFAEDAVVVLWYPPETVPSFGRPSAAALGALTTEEFAAEYARDEPRRASLAFAGARLVVQGGRITTLIENPTP